MELFVIVDWFLTSSHTSTFLTNLFSHEMLTLMQKCIQINQSVFNAKKLFVVTLLQPFKVFLIDYEKA